MKKLLLTLAIFCSIPAFAQTTTNNTTNTNTVNQTQPSYNNQEHQMHERRELPPEVKAALEQCRASAPKESDGRPVRGSIRQCMESKGFHPPMREHHQNNQPQQ
jgi:hypothetical protein